MDDETTRGSDEPTADSDPPRGRRGASITSDGIVTDSGEGVAREPDDTEEIDRTNNRSVGATTTGGVSGGAADSA